MKKIYLLPSLFTLGNIFCGFYSLVNSINGFLVQHGGADIAQSVGLVKDAHFYYIRAAYIIILAGFFDVFDGKVARATNSTSRFGVEFDSLADLVSFGVAPATLVYLWTLYPLHRIGWLAAFLFVICGALRLARFNVQSGTISSDRFVGLPIPMAAGMLVTTVIFHEDWFGPDMRHPKLIALMVYGVAVLMVSGVRYKSTKNIHLKGKSLFKVMVAASVFFVIIVLRIELMLFLLSFSYIVFGLLEAVPGFNKLLYALHLKKPAEQISNAAVKENHDDEEEDDDEEDRG